MNNLVLAYLGDAVYELYVRKYLIDLKISKVSELQTASLKYVSAKGQRIILEKLKSNDIFTDDELEIIKRGRNSPGHKSKSTDIITYKLATGLETLIGHLYINDKERLDSLMKIILGIE